MARIVHCCCLVFIDEKAFTMNHISQYAQYDRGVTSQTNIQYAIAI